MSALVAPDCSLIDGSGALAPECFFRGVRNAVAPASSLRDVLVEQQQEFFVADAQLQLLLMYEYTAVATIAVGGAVQHRFFLG